MDAVVASKELRVQGVCSTAGIQIEEVGSEEVGRAGVVLKVLYARTEGGAKAGHYD